MAFIEEYFLNPILQNGWFNPVNTLVYGVVLVVAAYLVFRMLRRMKVRIDYYFLIAVLPFIFWGSSTRVLHDAAFAGVLTGPVGEFYSMPIFPTPGSYFITFGLALAVLAISLGIQRWSKIPYWKPMLSAGLAMCVINMILMPYTTLYPAGLIIGVTCLWAALFFLLGHLGIRLKNKLVKNLFSRENSGLLTVHMLDASSTWAALTFFGYSEQHVVPNMLIPVLGPAAMFLLKLAVMLPVLYLIDKNTERGEFRNFLKIVILILGLAPGLRDMIRLVAMV
jgi:uncharacterized membrane protein